MNRNKYRIFPCLLLPLFLAPSLGASGVSSANHQLQVTSPRVASSSKAASDFPVLDYNADPAIWGLAEPRGVGGLSWFDRSRFNMSHSLEYGFSTGSAWGSTSGGLWTTRLGYRIADPLQLNVDVGAWINTDGGQVINQNSFFLKSLNLEYRPSKNFRMQIAYHGAPSDASPWYYGRNSVTPWSTRSVLDQDRFEEPKAP